MHDECPACGRHPVICRCEPDPEPSPANPPDFWAGLILGFLIGLVAGAVTFCAAVVCNL